jgi:hypothetical protein
MEDLGYNRANSGIMGSNVFRPKDFELTDDMSGKVRRGAQLLGDGHRPERPRTVRVLQRRTPQANDELKTLRISHMGSSNETLDLDAFFPMGFYRRK